MVVHTCNPSYSEGRDRRIAIGGQPSQKLVRPYLENKMRQLVERLKW
jgi:hypothetical protein